MSWVEKCPPCQFLEKFMTTQNFGDKLVIYNQHSYTQLNETNRSKKIIFKKCCDRISDKTPLPCWGLRTEFTNLMKRNKRQKIPQNIFQLADINFASIMNIFQAFLSLLSRLAVSGYYTIPPSIWLRDLSTVKFLTLSYRCCQRFNKNLFEY